MSDQVEVTTLPPCDICRMGKIDLVPAYVDGKTFQGPWAYMCEEHFTELGVGLGTGRGQRLILKRKDA